MVAAGRKKGHADAQLGLGDIYKRGYGVPQNYILAYMWYAISAHDPEYKSDAESHLNEITPDMAPSQIAEAQRLAEQSLKFDYMTCNPAP